MDTKGLLEREFARFYLIYWGTQIVSMEEARRFVQEVNASLGLSSVTILKFFHGLLDEGVVLSEEVNLVEAYLWRVK